MKKTRSLILMWLFIITSCQKKAIPVITERKNDVTKKAVKTFPTLQPDTLAGKSIFITRCSRCHDLPEPFRYTAQRWDRILSYMIPRARLNGEQGVHITAYLKANAAK